MDEWPIFISSAARSARRAGQLGSFHRDRAALAFDLRYRPDIAIQSDF